MKKVYPKSHGGFSYEIMDEEAYERFWWGRRPSSREAFEAWLKDPNKTQHQLMIESGKTYPLRIIRELLKAGIIRRFKTIDHMEKVYPKSHGGFSYEIMDEEAYERFWWGRRPSSREDFESWLKDPNKTQHQLMIESGKTYPLRTIRKLLKAGIIRRFKRENYERSEHKKRRGEIDIFAEILYLANEGGVTKTSIVHQANLNFKIVERHLSNLLERDLIEVKDKIYETTDRGITFLHHYEELGKLGMAS